MRRIETMKILMPNGKTPRRRDSELRTSSRSYVDKEREKKKLCVEDGNSEVLTFETERISVPS